jgi:coenzyme PQQ biosynthesis protein PqqD
MPVTTIDKNHRPRRTPQVIAQKASQDWLLFNMEDGQYFSLNEIGGRVWGLCDGTHNVAQIVEVLAKEYDAPVEVLEQDVLELLENFQNGKLII